MREKRTEKRLLCADLVALAWKDSAGKLRKSTGVLEDISRSGACLQLESAVPVDSVVTLHLSYRRVRGTVKYCVFRDSGYFVGLEFAAEVKWNRQLFLPDHLLDVQQMVARSVERAARRELPATGQAVQ